MTNSLCYASATIRCYLHMIICVLHRRSSLFHRLSLHIIPDSAEYEQLVDFLQVVALSRYLPRSLSIRESLFYLMNP
ncbi:hypothetical protein NY2A_b352R [Paramecium bursaria Chlorella virus NY2A]|uniref:Uncharacterized protein b352R n=1 Tax=Paramecium bursaria Chlorella virus NY2A TaxID=46021 RepID=A7IWM7_PBCVN|nr:hypothetical protein NY2A_b352R [Paramecium bursaria Chlorella virus NY2A]ABT14751.1 hypothetical protein NY2A_b352R [Paramecium bursaria Chlorella virus NY2A]